jgi:hypothetical protein
MVEARDELLDRRRGPAAGAGIGHDFVAVALEALDHVAAHPAEPDHAKLHLVLLARWS